MLRRFEFVSVPAPTKPGFGLTSSDRQKVRSRAAKNDPFAVEFLKRPKKDRPRRGFDDQVAGIRFSSHSRVHRWHATPDALIPPDIAQLQKSADKLSLSVPVSPELDAPRQEDDEGYFSTAISPNDHVAVREMELDEHSNLLAESNRISQRCNEELKAIALVPGVQGYMSAGRVDPFWTFPIQFRACLPAVIHHEIHHLAPVVPGLDVGEERNLLRWFALGLDEPAHLFASLAFSAAHLLDAGSPRATYEDVFYLKGSAISAVNEALQVPDRATSAGIIGAVMILAAFEFAFGDTETYRTHMDGTKEMIKMRGGLESLEPWVTRFLKWVGSSSAVWKVFWPYSRQMDLSSSLETYNREEAAKETFIGD